MSWEYIRRFVVLFAISLFTLLAVMAFWKDVGGNALDIAENNLINDATIFTAYIDDTIQNRLGHLEQLSKTVDRVLDEDEDMAKEMLRDYKNLFSSLTILSTDGAKEYGDHITIRFNDSDGVLEELMYNKQPVVYSDSIKEISDKEVIVIAVPIESGNKVTGIIVGTLNLAVLNEVMDKWGYAQAGCAFLITSNGKYVTRGKKFDSILGGKANSFFTYLANSEIEGDIDSLKDVEREVENRRQVSLRYRYGRSDYISVLCPSSFANWYVGFIEEAGTLQRANIRMQDSTVIFMAICGILLCFGIVYIVILLHKSFRAGEDLERYNILNQIERAIIFEFQFEPKCLRFFGNTLAMFGREVKPMFGEEVYEVYQYIHEDDRSIRGRIHQFYDNDNKRFMSEVRIKNSEEGYGWYRITGMLVKDMKYGENHRFIGKIEDASQQIIEEKSLVQRAENDLLTGVLNKKTMEEKVSECLANIAGNTHYIFFMVDLDNFKNVNDKLGHIYGDNAIVDTAKYLSEIFSKNAYVGRLGGDEFAVCASYDAFDEESLMSYIKKRAEKICEVNRRTYVNGAVSVSISSSVGVAVAPEAGRDFETIYKMADSALYRSKNGGKNCYNIYQKN